MDNYPFYQASYEESKTFGKNQRNRAINMLHVAVIQKQCETSFDLMPPITVNKVTNHVIDGQHRLQAYQNLIEKEKLNETKRIWVMWVEVPIELETQAIINANIHSKSWSVDDFIDSYVKDGNAEYIKLDLWCRSHTNTFERNKPKYRYASAILTGRNCASTLKKGEFTITDEDIKRGNDVYNEMTAIMGLYGLKTGPWIEPFVIKWYEYRDSHSFEDWMDALKQKKFTDNKKFPKSKQDDWDTIFLKASKWIKSHKAA